MNNKVDTEEEMFMVNHEIGPLQGPNRIINQETRSVTFHEFARAYSYGALPLPVCIQENGLLGYAKTKSKTKWEAYLAPRLRRGSHLLLVLFHTVTSQLTNTETKLITAACHGCI